MEKVPESGTIFTCGGGKARAIAAERMHLVALRHTPQAREKLAQFLKPVVSFFVRCDSRASRRKSPTSSRTTPVDAPSTRSAPYI